MNGFWGVPKRNNCHLLTFVIIKFDSRTVRPPRLILRLPTDLKMFLKVNFEFQSHLKFFWRTSSQTITFRKKHFFMIQMRFSSQFFIIVENHKKIATCARLRE